MQITKEKIEKLIPKLRFPFPYSAEDYAENLYLENYHCHTDMSNSSVPDCAESIENYAIRIKELGAKCLYSGEHGNQGNQFAVYSVAEQNKLSYRHSAEAYWVKDRHESDKTNCHIMLISKTAEGRKDLNFALSIANEDGYYYKPRLDLELLLNIPKDNMIVTSACFTKGNKVLTKQGYINIEDVRCGDLVKNRYGEWETVNYPTVIGYKGDGYAFDLEGKLNNICCTKDHKFLTTTMNDLSQNKPIKWTTAEEIYYRKNYMSNHVQDILLYPINVEYSNNDTIYQSEWDESFFPRTQHFWSKKYFLPEKIKITRELMMFFGFFIGDGCITLKKNKRICFTVNYNEFEYYYDGFFKPVEEQLKTKFGYIKRKETNRVDITSSSTDLINLFYYLFGNCKADTKHIPSRLLHINKELDYALLLGMLLSDGNFRQTKKESYVSGRFTYSTISDILSQQFIDLCDSLMIKVTIDKKDEFTDKNNVHHQKSFRLESSAKYWGIITKMSKVDLTDFIRNIESLYDNSNIKPFVKLDNVWYKKIRIKNIETIKIDDYVYCLNNNSHSFVLNGVVVHNCLAGWNYEDAEDCWLKLAKHFGDNFFVELQYHNTDKQKKYNKRALNFAKQHNLQTIVGLDSHYVKPENAIKRDQILKYKGVNYPDEEGWYMDYPDTKEIIRRFEEQGVLTEEEILISIMNTNVFVKECEEIVFDRHFKIPTIYPHATYEEKVKIYKKELNKAYKKEKLRSKEKADGIKWEAQQIIESETVDYFLTSQKIIDLAVNKYGGILTTTSRGSMASFCSNKLLGLTTVDRFNAEIPIYPERFITKERILSGSMPDCDLNLSEQEPFVKATRELLGEHACYPLMALSKLKEKAAWQLYAGANDVSPSDSNTISKYLDEYNKKLKHADEDEKENIHVEDFIPEEYIELYKQSLEYQGITINLLCHACGHLLINGDIRREVGLISAVSESTGERTLCAAVEGRYLDDFGYCKEDFLIVDSVALTHKLFQSIGQPVPSFEELKDMVKGDVLTWDIYAQGITCCVNQCEKESTTNKVKKYKPQDIAELSAFIAGIRPGFSSLINVFLHREEYSTGESKVDELLIDSAHFCLYQESIMKVLSFLGLPMSDTYGIIKSISKKKLKGEKKENLLKQLKASWLQIFGNLDNFNNVWKVIEDSAFYAFNAPHAYSMAGDSLYQAWFKAHHTAKFYEVAITHYQEKNKKDKIDALIKEAMKFYGYQLGDYEFGTDNRKVNIDEKTKTIYPNLSSVKGFGEGVVDTLYELGQQEYDSFIDILNALASKSINKTLVDKLIKINYFKKIGDINTLLETTRYYQLLYGVKQMSKIKIEESGLSVEFVAKYGNETAKQVNKLDSTAMLKDLIKMIPYRELTVKEILDNQKEVLDILTYVDPTVSKRLYYVYSVEKKQTIVNTDLYEIYSGAHRFVKQWRSQHDRNPFDEKDILNIYKIEKKNQREPSGAINPDTGKKIYVEIPDKFEYWISGYSKGGEEDYDRFI